ncbi:MAG: RagB/SusD family nutrient uptake outer membrane protein, partial [Bacteroidales bacterium]|nr:RagB/SusD family nutrient uptake outer membrane protein [Bacteroidales bacterium]
RSYIAPYKYRSYSSSSTSNPDDSRKENSTVFRLAEQYLIRAEARAQQNKLDLAIADVDAIRARAGLPLIENTNPGIGKAALLDAIMQERRVELFTEWGHRWFDLKRTGKAVAVLSAIKTGFSANDLLYPIPASELNKDPFLEQNPGY